MTQTYLNFKSDNPWNYGSQNFDLWEYLRVYGQVTTRELHEMGYETARLRDMRKRGMMIECVSIEGDRSNRLYKVVG